MEASASTANEDNLDMVFEIKVRAKIGTRHGKTDLTSIPGMAKRCQARENDMPQGHTGAQSSGAQIKGKPTNEQASTLQALQKRAAFLSPANTICIFISIIFMASARFFG